MLFYIPYNHGVSRQLVHVKEIVCPLHDRVFLFRRILSEHDDDVLAHVDKHPLLCTNDENHLMIIAIYVKLHDV